MADFDLEFEFDFDFDFDSLFDFERLFSKVIIFLFYIKADLIPKCVYSLSLDFDFDFDFDIDFFIYLLFLRLKKNFSNSFKFFFIYYFSIKRIYIFKLVFLKFLKSMLILAILKLIFNFQTQAD